ncbi:MULTISPECIES: helix-turn-helix domain-containing protein [Kordiimonas]|uniref:helix-turn-helix domain-containing protein n=1 Tax=Kordiimonas TaxID=288021 RepID=UPI001FF65917|nr:MULTISPECIES: helix-turn-helix transcriptional regulator [Kordiimonas]MCK0069425.1 helix-turn-helix transcriptional regulator [Kordiimonas laminariae]UTW58771.1 helix-turn-helix transcriptional regulator [Kordiimonas sp. SCSIO 12603]
MTIIINLDIMLAKRKMQSKELASRIGVTVQNLSILKRGKARAVRLETLNAICKVLECQPGDILEFQDEAQD